MNADIERIIRSRRTPLGVVPLNARDATQLRLWFLRILVPLEGYKEFVRKTDFMSDDIARQLGLEDIVDSGTDAAAFDRQSIVSRLRRSWEDAEQDQGNSGWVSEEYRTLREIGNAIGLSEVDVEILGFRIAVERYHRLSFLLQNCTGKQDYRKLLFTVATCLNRPVADIEKALAFDGTLLATGIVQLNLRHCFGFLDTLQLLGSIAEEIHVKHVDPLMYFRSWIGKSLPPKLTGEHFPHVQRDHVILSDYLKASIGARRPGVNILIHGDPGSGKTEFIRMLATEIGSELYEIASEGRDDGEQDAEQRFRAYRLSQALFARSTGKLILFDEVEDVFRDSDRGKKTDSNNSSRKAWVNRLLESNPVPAFWISNNIHVIDRAYLRRFDYVLEMKAPPCKVRSRILEQYLGDLPVSDSWKRRMAEHEDLMPAVVERAAKVVRSARELAPDETERSLARVIGNTLEVMGLARDPRNPALSTGYRLDVLNTDCDMVEIQHSLVSHRQGRICLYGPPGTGKTAYGRHVASELDRPLLVRRASDIISPWLGMTERNLARMFRQAQEEEAVLLLDEADSFLQDRQNAQRSWELTEVNEMLTQMESFEGIFIASTNLMESLDSAALRRFDLKIRFDYLKPEQAWALFVDTRMHLGIDDGMDLQSAVARLTCLTPGDFANVVRQARLRPVRSSMTLLHRLKGECEMKPEGRRKAIGFAA